MPCGPVWLSGKALRLVSRGTPVQIRFGSLFTSEVVVCGHCLVTLPLTINEILIWLSGSLPMYHSGVRSHFGANSVASSIVPQLPPLSPTSKALSPPVPHRRHVGVELV